MKRDEFIKAALKIGACACTGTILAAQGAVLGQDKSSEDIEALKWKLDFVRRRFAKLVAILDSNLDQLTRKKIFESMGRECAKLFMDLTGKYQGNPQGFLDEIQKRWARSAEYDSKAGTIRVIDKSDHCTCAFVDEQLTPAAFCDCTLGWQKETYSMILGEPVDAQLEESVLRGGKRCVFRMQVISKT